MDKPEKTFNAGGVQASIFLNARTVKGKEVKIPSISFQKRYLENGEWKSTTSLSINDLCKAILVLGKAYDYSISLSKGKETAENDEDLQEA